jgi:multiple antibiotic resistance protein
LKSLTIKIPGEEFVRGNFHDFWLCFVPLFVAVDALGTLPIFVSLVGKVEQRRVNRVIRTSLLTALLVAVPFIFLGEWVLRLLNITVADFMIAGGIVLLLLSVRDLLSMEKRSLARNPDGIGPVPLGVPLIVGPAVLTTILLLVRQEGFLMTTAAAVVNILLAGTVFAFSGLIIRVIGRSGTQIASKIANLLLAAIAVMLVRKGVIIIISRGVIGQ